MPKNNDFTRNLLPQSRGRRLALFNKHALIPLGKVNALMRERQFTETLRGLDIAKKARTTRWLTAVEMLEECGYVNGLDPADLAEKLGISLEAARNAMNRAEYVIFDVFGLHITFLRRGERWRLLDHKEATQKYARTVRDLSTRSKRAKLYENISRYHGTEQEELQVPIFRFDFTPEALPYEAQN